MKVFEPLADWLEAQNGNTSSPLAGRLDLEQVVVGGHSRGGKMATLLFAGTCCGVERAQLAVPLLSHPAFTHRGPRLPSLCVQVTSATAEAPR